MSVSLKFVDYNGIFKQKHDFTTYDLYNTLGDLVVLEADYFGTFSLVEDVVELGDTHHTIYQSNKMCSRGFGLSVNEAQNTFDFNLYFPATTADIDLMFRFIKEFVKSLNEPKFYIDNDEVDYSYIDDINKDLVKENQRIILELKDEKDFIITGKDYPFYLDEYFLQSIKDEEDIDFVRKVEEYMYEQQEIDAYFARPYVVLENDDATEAVPVFSMGSDIPFLFYYDKKTYVIPFQNNINFIKWLITIKTSLKEETVDFDKFMANIPSDKIVHINKVLFYVKPLSDDELLAICDPLEKELLERE